MYLEEIIGEIVKVSGLSERQAKIVLYYAGATHGLLHLRKFPILCVQGEPGTGKSAILEILQVLCKGASKFTGRGTSEAAARDELPFLGTAIIEEADTIKEDHLFNRHDRSISKMPYKEAGEDGYKQTNLQLFGATVLHRRDGADSGALASRSIDIHTRFTEGVVPLDAEIFEQFREELRDMAKSVDWRAVPTNTGSRSRDTWQPILAFAKNVGDEEFLDSIEQEIDKLTQSLKFGMNFETRQAVYGSILNRATSGGKVRESVELKDVTEQIRSEPEFSQYSSRKVGTIVREIGFAVIKYKGEMRVVIGDEEKLVNIGHELGVEDEWLNR